MNVPVNRTYFKDPKHFYTASHLVHALMTYKAKRDDLWVDGKVPVESIYAYLAEQHPPLSYLDFEHIVELDLRQERGGFRILGDYLIPTQPVTVDKPIEAPDTLYLGSIRRVATSAINNGLKSRTKDYVLLTSDKNIATLRARQFSKTSFSIEDPTEKAPVLITVDARSAQAESIVFLGGEKKHLYKVSYLSNRFLSVEEIPYGEG